MQNNIYYRSKVWGQYNFFIINKYIQLCRVITKINISNKCCSVVYSIHKRILKRFSKLITRNVS